MKPILPVGFHQFHKNKFYNYQLNRWYSLGYTRIEDIQKAATAINSFDSYRNNFALLAQEAVTEKRLKNAAFYFRAAEFLTNPSHPDKIPLYNQFRDAFYVGFQEDNIERYTIAYEKGFLSAMRLAPAKGTSKGTVVIHGGFDSLIEEFYCFWAFFAAAGYEVIAFDGPGQGSTLRTYGIHFDHNWEKPVKAVLGYFNLSNVTLIGISMGGYWCLRAAAFEKRIRRVIVFPPVYDWMENTNCVNRVLVDWMLRWKWLMRELVRLKMKSPLLEHVINQTLFITGETDPLNAVSWLLAMNKKNIHSELVDQDVLLLAGERDYFQPVNLYYKQMKALTNAKSVTGKIFTQIEQAEHHCGIGNVGYSLEIMLKWLEVKESKS
jgi:pimeloyl-ACP methyl ester carboxylesterase